VLKQQIPQVLQAYWSIWEYHQLYGILGFWEPCLSWKDIWYSIEKELASSDADKNNANVRRFTFNESPICGSHHHFISAIGSHVDKVFELYESSLAIVLIFNYI